MPLRLAPIPLFLSACTASPVLEYDLDDLPETVAASTTTEVTFSADLAYGERKRQRLDVAMPASDAPTPLVVYIHGGGFFFGDKELPYEYRAEEIGRLLDAGVAYATVGYRLLQEGDEEGVGKSLDDARRAVQFLRYYADSLNIDPERIAVQGTSAGASSALYLLTHDDLADPDAEDPIEGVSTRVAAAAVHETQATLDIQRWLDEVFEPYGITLDLAATLGMEDTLKAFYGMDSVDDFYGDAVTRFREDIDVLANVSDDDGALWIANASADVSLPLDANTLYHHPYHAQVLDRFAVEAGMTTVTYIPKLGVEDPSGEDAVDFLLRSVE